MGIKESETTSPAFSTTSLPDVTTTDDQPIVPGTSDRVKISKDTTTYTNSGHWTSILDGISELKEHLDQIPNSAHARDNNAGDLPGPDILFGRQRHATKQELLAALPPRSEANQLVFGYFVSVGTLPMMLHRPSFYKEYEAFWLRPFEVSEMWLALLYAVLSGGAQFQVSDGETLRGDTQRDSLNIARVDLYREKAVQAMILANYTKCPPFTIDALLSYFCIEFMRSSDTQFSMWVLTGMIVRIALRMGYHRDPSRFANISPFEAEVRRRSWLTVLTLDLVSSAQVGLPRMIQPFMYDTQEPRNLDEEELYEEMEELPPSHPEIELTPLLYSIVSARVRNVHAKIMDLTNATSLPPYRDVMSVDALLRHVYDKLPVACQALASEGFDLATDPTSTRRLYLGLSFLKAELMLHRPYLLPGRTDIRYDYSRRVCLNAAFKMLELQQKLDSEIQPGGKLWVPGWQLFTISWYLSSVVASDFLLATTVLILDLDKDLTAPSPLVYNGTTSGLELDRAPPSHEAIAELLRATRRIWLKAGQRSHEARKAAEAIRLVLDKTDSSEQYASKDFNAPMVEQTSSFISPAPSWDQQDLGSDTTDASLFAMDGMYTSPFAFNEMPMNPGQYSDTYDAYNTWIDNKSDEHDGVHVSELCPFSSSARSTRAKADATIAATHQSYFGRQGLLSPVTCDLELRAHSQ
ncbi:hypothetical protein ACEQ8H_007806 [Pleosporales sp. CAS-2024a]